MNIYQKMSAVTMEINAVAKNLSVGTGKNQYKAVGEADVLYAVKPIEAKHGIYSFPYSREIVDSGEMVSTNNYNGQTTEKRQLYLRIKTVYRFVNTDDPNEYIDITTFGDGVDTQDKAPGKAMTYGDKYALLKAYKILTGEDPDQNYSDDLQDVNRGQSEMVSIVTGINMFIEKNPQYGDFLNQAFEKAGVNDLYELADKEPTFVKNCYKKWCK